MEQPKKFINNLNISTNNTDLNTIGIEITALKIAVGLIFQKLQDPLREAYLKELRQLNYPALNELADQLEQFKI